jgi:hypothetical protein
MSRRERKRTSTKFRNFESSPDSSQKLTTGVPIPDSPPNVIDPLADEDLALEYATGIRRVRLAPAPKIERVEALDFARGIAICLMILSHGIKGLMMFEQMPAWGLVPIHLITKFSSSLFILIFGMTLALSVVPHIGAVSWPRKRKQLLVRGLLVFFWYKMLTILEMSHLFGRDEIISALEYKTFPSYVEILGFYSIALLWIPWVLPYWKRCHASVRILFPIGIFGLATFLTNYFGFFGSVSLQAILVEHPDHYAWGQLTRAPLVFIGLQIGWMIQQANTTRWPRLIPAGVLAAIGLSLFSAFFTNAGDALDSQLIEIAKNAGKHPPELQFMLFSLGGAFLLLSISLWGGNTLANAIRPLTTIGKNSLRAFVFHICVIFIFYRFLFDYFHKIEYGFALGLTLALIAMTYAWVKIVPWVKENS